ncbi:MAG: plastocyanin/azurin family copper-binding protein [Thaumarchaeota archaeon]|nr:plastocyanin/azurin family copper-binding protein [Nitrososphaerota archaeon]
MTENMISRKSPEVLVPLVGLLYSGLYLLYITITVLPTGATFIFMLIPFMVLFLVLAYGVWRMNRFAFVGSIILSGIFLLFFGSFLEETIGNPSSFSMFFAVVTVVFSLITTIVYSVLGVRTFWRKGTVIAVGKTIPRSSFFALVMVGFITGALVVGVFAGATEVRLLGNVGKTANIVIVQGAGTQGNAAGYFSPSNFTAKVGQTVTWSNGDGSTHTVTSKGSSLFDSGNIASGGTFSYTFTQAGTYQYYCTIHPWMIGTVVVTSG